MNVVVVGGEIRRTPPVLALGTCSLLQRSLISENNAVFRSSAFPVLLVGNLNAKPMRRGGRSSGSGRELVDHRAAVAFARRALLDRLRKPRFDAGQVGHLLPHRFDLQFRKLPDFAAALAL